MNFDAVSKKAKIMKIGPVERKLWKIRQNAGVKIIFTEKIWSKKLNNFWIVSSQTILSIDSKAKFHSTFRITK